MSQVAIKGFSNFHDVLITGRLFTMHPYRQIELIEAISSGTPRSVAVKRFSERWGVTRWAIYKALARIARSSSQSITSNLAKPSTPETIERIQVLASALREGLSTREILKRYSVEWSLSEDMIENLLRRARASMHDEINQGLSDARKQLHAHLVGKLTEARDAGEFERAVKIYEQLLALSDGPNQS